MPDQLTQAHGLGARENKIYGKDVCLYKFGISAQVLYRDRATGSRVFSVPPSRQCPGNFGRDHCVSARISTASSLRAGRRGTLLSLAHNCTVVHRVILSRDAPTPPPISVPSPSRPPCPPSLLCRPPRALILSLESH